jgi:hypothetical protein
MSDTITLKVRREDLKLITEHGDLDLFLAPQCGYNQRAPKWVNSPTNIHNINSLAYWMDLGGTHSVTKWNALSDEAYRIIRELQ